MSKVEQNSGTRLNCAPLGPFIRSPQKKTAQRELRACAFIKVTRRDLALNNAVRSEAALEFSAELSEQITSLLFKLL